MYRFFLNFLSIFKTYSVKFLFIFDPTAMSTLAASQKVSFFSQFCQTFLQTFYPLLHSVYDEDFWISFNLAININFGISWKSWFLQSVYELKVVNRNINFGIRWKSYFFFQCLFHFWEWPKICWYQNQNRTEDVQHIWISSLS